MARIHKVKMPNNAVYEVADYKINAITGASTGQTLVISSVDSNGTPTGMSATNMSAAPSVGTISMTTTWSGNGPYTQTVTVTGATVTANSKVDLQPNSTALEQMISDGVTALWIENNNGTLTAKVLGAAPTAALSIQCTITEVST